MWRVTLQHVGKKEKEKKTGEASSSNWLVKGKRCGHISHLPTRNKQMNKEKQFLKEFGLCQTERKGCH